MYVYVTRNSYVGIASAGGVESIESSRRETLDNSQTDRPTQINEKRDEPQEQHTRSNMGVTKVRCLGMYALYGLSYPSRCQGLLDVLEEMVMSPVFCMEEMVASLLHRGAGGRA